MGSRNQIKHSLRDKIFEESEGYCVLAGPNCTVFATTIDHWIPRTKGGTNRKDNLRASCWKCNRDKGRLWPEEWQAYLADFAAGIAPRMKHGS